MEQHEESIGTKKDLCLHRIQTAKENLKSAKILLGAKEYKSANNRAYYAIFHAINAIHALTGKAYKRHKDAIANFNKDYVKTAIFPREIGRKIGEAEEIRHASDYDDFYIASREETERQIAVADEFIRLVENYCTVEPKENEDQMMQIYQAIGIAKHKVNGVKQNKWEKFTIIQRRYK